MFKRTLISLFMIFILGGCKSAEFDPKVSVVKWTLKNGSKVVVPSKVLIQNGFTNLQSGSPGTAAGTSST